MHWSWGHGAQPNHGAGSCWEAGQDPNGVQPQSHVADLGTGAPAKGKKPQNGAVGPVTELSGDRKGPVVEVSG